MANSWQTMGNIQPQKLTESKLQLHYAIQFIAATGSALAELLPDYSHTSLEWNPVLKVFTGALIQAKIPFRVALNPLSFTLIILDKHEDTIAAFPLHQKTMTEGLNWLKGEIYQLGADADKVVFLSYPPDDFPDHVLARGATFDASQELGRQELTNYYANTHQLLQEIIATTEDVSSIHIWPHHFDIATLYSLSGTKNGEQMTVGIGLSPGDINYDEPYWYVSPYPYPETENLPPLDGNGFWHTQHWVGAVLRASQLSENGTAEAQQEQVRLFLHSGLQAGKLLLKS